MPRADAEPRQAGSWSILVVEIAVYSVMVAAYLLVVLRALRPVLLATEQHHRVLYGVLSVVLMLGQGVLLEFLTSLLVGRFRRARRDEQLEA
ncbi:MAG: hypothetical protein ABI682_02335 [Acidobacteriota bacterium]